MPAWCGQAKVHDDWTLLNGAALSYGLLLAGTTAGQHTRGSFSLLLFGDGGGGG